EDEHPGPTALEADLVQVGEEGSGQAEEPEQADKERQVA
ncbi:hypothetical protein LCGC14_2021160, partial [marine sediment metagenome]